MGRKHHKNNQSHHGGKRPDGGSGDKPGGRRGFLIFGKHAVLAAIGNPARTVHRVLATKNTADELNLAAQAEIVHPQEIDKLLPPGTVHQGIAAEVARLPEKGVEDVKDAAIIVILDQVTDPHNVGAILRSCAAFGAAAVIVHDKNSPEETGVLAKSASGALETIPLIRVTNISSAMEELKEYGFWCIGLDGEAKEHINKIHDYEKVVLVLGAEGKGIRRLVRENCDLLAKVPINDSIESLNVSNAAAVALYEITRS